MNITATFSNGFTDTYKGTSTTGHRPTSTGDTR